MHKYTYIMILVASWFTACGPSQSPSSQLHDAIASDHFDFISTPYADRYAAVRQLAVWYPGQRQRAGLGLWAGIQLQTEWQQQTKRDATAHWSFANAILTMFPYEIAKAMQDGQDYCATPVNWNDDANARIKGEYQSACAKWQLYYRYHRDGRAVRGEAFMQKLLWDAHTASLEFVQAASAEAFSPAELPLVEYRYWRGWIKFVEALDEADFPTTDHVVRPINDNFLAPCGLLGEGRCQVHTLPKWGQQALAVYLIDENTSLNFLIGWVSLMLQPWN